MSLCVTFNTFKHSLETQVWKSSQHAVRSVTTSVVTCPGWPIIICSSISRWWTAWLFFSSCHINVACPPSFTRAGLGLAKNDTRGPQHCRDGRVVQSAFLISQILNEWAFKNKQNGGGGGMCNPLVSLFFFTVFSTPFVMNLILWRLCCHASQIRGCF